MGAQAVRVFSPGWSCPFAPSPLKVGGSLPHLFPVCPVPECTEFSTCLPERSAASASAHEVRGQPASGLDTGAPRALRPTRGPMGTSASSAKLFGLAVVFVSLFPLFQELALLVNEFRVQLEEKILQMKARAAEFGQGQHRKKRRTKTPWG